MIKETLNDQHLVIFRTSCSVLNLKTYNCQELGLSKALNEKGLKVSLVLAGEKESTETFDGVQIFRLPFKAINQQLGLFLGYKKLLEKINPTLIQVHDMGLFMSFAVTRWAKSHGIPCFLIQGNYETTRKPFLKQFEICFNLLFGRYILQNVAGIGCKTKRASQYVKSYLNCETKVTHVGLDVSKFDNSVDREWKKDLGLQEKKVLLYVGAIEHRRNPFFLLEILSHLSNNYVLLIAGEGSLKQEVKKKIVEKGLTDRCFLLGKIPQNQLPSLYKSSDVFLLASNYEIYGMVVLEAMYFGVPVISSCTAGSESLIIHGKDGYVMRTLDPKSWTETIEQTVGNPKMKIYARKKIEKEFLWDKIADQFLDLYFDK